MRMTNPALPGQFAEVDGHAFTYVWEPRGWVEAPVLPDISVMTVPDVLDLVGDDPGLIAVALHEEKQGRARTTLIEPLERVAAAASPDTAGDGEEE